MNNLFIIDPTFIEIGGISIQWYAIFILIGILVAYITGVREAKKLGIKKSTVLDGVLYCVPLSIIGARLYYVFFYKLENPNSFSSLYEIINIRSGGLAIHGGIITAIIFMYFFCKKRNISIFKVVDFVAPGFLIGQIFGRIGNFINREAYGSAVSREFLENVLHFPNWMIEQMYIGGEYHHPTFFYEMLWNIIGLTFILIVRRKKFVKSGDLVGFYLIWYGIGRAFLVEPFRTDSLMLGNIKVNILNSLIFALIGIGYLIFKRIKLKAQPYYYEIIENVEKEKIKTVIFDLDGTLVNTFEVIKKSFRHIFEKHFKDVELTEELLYSFVGPSLKQTFRKYAKSESEVEQLVLEYHSYKKKIFDEFVMTYPTVKRTIKILKRNHYNIAIVTNNVLNQVKMALKFAGLDEYFDVIITSENAKPKPDGDGIIKAVNYFNDAKACYVGDTKLDVRASKEAKVISIAINHKFNQDEILSANPDYVINQMDEILDILNV